MARGEATQGSFPCTQLQAGLLGDPGWRWAASGPEERGRARGGGGGQEGRLIHRLAACAAGRGVRGEQEEPGRE